MNPSLDRIDSEETVLNHQCYKKVKLDSGDESRIRRPPCQDCKIKHKLQLKQQQQDNRRKQYQRYEKIQDELLRSINKPKETVTSNQSQLIIKAYKEMEEEVEKTAQIQAQKYLLRENTSPLSSGTTSDAVTVVSSPMHQKLEPPNLEPLGESLCPSEALVTLYKVLLLPEDALSMYVRSQTESVLAKEYRNMVRLVHPDKNNHPKACQAFNKLHKYWVERRQ